MDIFDLIGQVGVPIAIALVMGLFVFIIIKKIMDDLVDDIKQLENFSNMLITRVKVMNNDMIKIDVSVSASVGLKPDLERISRAENFVEKGTIDARRDYCYTTVWVSCCYDGRTRLFCLLCMDNNNRKNRPSNRKK